MSLQRFLDGMDQDKMEIDELQKNLLDALRYFVGKIVEQQLSPKVPSREFVSALTGLVFTLLVDHLPNELIAFCRHANRKGITDEDIYLYTRKTSLCAHLKEYRFLMGDTNKKSTSKPRKSGKSTDIDPTDSISHISDDSNEEKETEVRGGSAFDIDDDDDF